MPGWGLIPITQVRVCIQGVKYISLVSMDTMQGICFLA